MAPRIVLFYSTLGFLLCLIPRGYELFLSPDLRIDFFDVGQGDSALVRFPYGGNLMVDAGWGIGDWSVAENELFGELTRWAQRRINIGLLSHPDADHGFGFLSLERRLGIQSLWYNARSQAPLLKELQDRIPALAWNRHATFSYQGVEWNLWPLRGKKRNDQSLVLSLRYGDCRVLFAGDVEGEGERAWLTQGGNAADLLKVAHHGSRTSSSKAFLLRAKPVLAILSVGKRNRYGHPHRQVIERFQNLGIPLLRTDLHGFVSVRIDGQRLHCTSALGNCGVVRCVSARSGR